MLLCRVLTFAFLLIAFAGLMHIMFGVTTCESTLVCFPAETFSRTNLN